MKKRFTAILLAAVLVLSLLPVQVFAVETVPAGWTPIYTLADLQDAINGYSAKKLILMNDIDADNEDLAYNVIVADGIREDMILDGNGHTIYNLKATLLEYCEGTVRNLNTTIHDTPEDEEHLKYVMSANYSGAKISIAGITHRNYGTIENCRTRFTLQGERSSVSLALAGIAVYNQGTIRDCIIAMDVDYHIKGGTWLTGDASFAGIASSNRDSDALIDHCLVLGTLIGSGAAYSSEAYGLTYMNSTARCVDSACALELLSLTCNDEYDFSPGFQTWTGSTDGAENCRVASDMKFEHVVTEDNINESGTVTAGEGYTLSSRASILADWDLSSLPGEAPDNIPSTKPTEPEETAEDPFPEGAAEFYYTASNGETREHYFYYNNYMFYSFDETYRYQPLMATASLCLAMSAFTNADNMVWNNTLAAQDTRRAFNIQRLYETLGFTNAKYVNYDKPLTDTSDKVAFSMAVKYIDDDEGGIDTVIAVPLRGGGYGGEWGSNFNMTYNGYDGNHVGFQRAASSVMMELSSYINALKQNGEIRGELKLWITGYSRSAATANILAHDICKASALGGVTVKRKNVYAYTFATPAGATLDSVESSYDPNIFNIISPVDIVPRVAPGAWEYGRYGNTLTLPITNSQKLIDTYQDLSGVEGQSGDLAIMPAQRVLLDAVTSWLFDYVPDADAYYNRGLNAALSEGMGSLLGKAPSYNQDAAVLTEVIKGTLDIFGTLKSPIKHALLDQLGKEAANFGRAHHPELYLARLETGNLNTVQDFAKAAMSKQIIVPIPISGGEPASGFTVGSASGRMGVFIYDSNNDLLASYEDGVCKSVSVTAEMTDMGLVFTLPDGEEDCTLAVGGLGEGEFSFAVFSYDGDHPDGPARTVDFTDFPLERGTVYAFSIPGGTDGDYIGYNEDQSETYSPDYDSEVDGERPLEYAVEVSFTDVSPNAYYYDAVQWAVEEGITSGTSATTFSPNASCTRAQAMTFLWRAAGSPEPESTRNPFTDVKAGSYYYDAVLWAVEQGITSGTTATTFSPNATCTRGQIVTFLYRSWGNPDIEVRASFRDVPAGAYYADSVSWAADWGVTSGTSATTFSPNASCTRAQIVTFLYRSFCG